MSSTVCECGSEAKIQCKCENLYLCELCIGKHLVEKPSLLHKPISLKELHVQDNTEPKQQNHKYELFRAIKSKLSNESLKLEELKNVGIQAITEVVRQAEKELLEAAELMTQKVVNDCETTQKKLSESVSLLKLGEISSDPILKQLKKCQTIEEVRNLELIQKKVEFKQVTISELVKNSIVFELKLFCGENDFPAKQPGKKSKKPSFASPRSFNARKSFHSFNVSAKDKKPKKSLQTPKVTLKNPNKKSIPELFDLQKIDSSEDMDLIELENPFEVVHSEEAKETPETPENSRETQPEAKPFSKSQTYSPSKLKSPKKTTNIPSLSKMSFSSPKPKQIELSPSKKLMPSPTRRRGLSARMSFPELPPCLYYFVPGTSTLVSYDTLTSLITNSDLECESIPEKCAWSTTPDGRLVLTGGFDSKPRPTTFIYNLQTKDFKRGPSMAHGRYNHTQTSTGNFLYVLGGCKKEGPIKDCEKLNLITNKWNKAGQMLIARESPASCVHKGRIYVAGGTGLNSIEAYNTVSEKFSLIRVRLPLPGRCCMFSNNESVLLFQESKVLSLQVSSMSVEEVSRTQQRDWWTPTDCVFKDALYFVHGFEVFRYDLESCVIEEVTSFN